MDTRELVDKLDTEHCLTTYEWKEILRGRNEQVAEYAATLARTRTRKIFGNKIFTRGLIEISNHCKNNCYYCGLRRDNGTVKRYRLTKEQILCCAETAYRTNHRTFVLQGGEDGTHTDEFLCDVIATLRERYPECAITLSLGERSEKSYILLYQAGANRYLLRHETADKEHYRELHPDDMDFEHRMRCLEQLKEIGYQVGCGFMVGSPGQTTDTIVKDMEFITRIQPHMVGIGPFLPHHATPFAKESAGSVEMTTYLLSLIRLLKPNVLLPATTALGTREETGREKGILAGANVVMPNVSPKELRKQYEIYDNKLATGAEGAEGWNALNERLKEIGYELAVDRGDAPVQQIY